MLIRFCSLIFPWGKIFVEEKFLLFLSCELFQVEEGWWSGTLNNKLGLFPSNFVQELEVTDDGEAHEAQEDSGRL